MKTLTILFLLMSAFCFGQTTTANFHNDIALVTNDLSGTIKTATQMQVKQSDIKIDESWQVVKNNLDQIQNYLNQQISVAKMDNKLDRADRLIALKKGLYSALRDFRNTSVETVETTITVDSLQTVNQLKKLTVDITALKALKATCLDCDTITIDKKLFDLKNEKNKLVGYTKNWNK